MRDTNVQQVFKSDIETEDNDRTTITVSKIRLLFVTITVCLASFMAMSDQTGITMLLSYISDDLNAHKSIQWVGTGALICSTIFNIIVGRFSDLFGCKILMMISLFSIGVFEIACCFIQNKIWFYICRAITGFGNGGIISLSMVIISNCVRPSDRGTFQGFLGLSIGLGSCMGPFIATAFANQIKYDGWRKYFFFIGTTMLLIFLISILSLKNDYRLSFSYKNKSNKDKWRSIDIWGIILSIFIVVLGLIPLNMGGILLKWDSLEIILCSVFCIISLILFILVEIKWAHLPLIPPKYFKNFRVLNLIIQTFLIGVVYSSLIYYLPFYLTSIQEKDITSVPFFFLALLAPLSIFSLISGYLTSFFNHYKWVIISGVSIFFIGIVSLSVLSENETSDTINVIIFITIGSGLGFIFTPTTIGIQTQVPGNEKSVILSTKAVFKTLGNSVGIAISSMVYSNTLLYQIQNVHLDEKDMTYILNNINRKVNLRYIYEGDKLKMLETIYSTSLRSIFITWIPLTIICLILSLFIHDEGLEMVVIEHDDLSEEQNKQLEKC